MASSKEMCETCLFDTKNNEATLFCVDCNEPLCEGCGAVHRKQRLSRHHKVFDIGNAPPAEVLATLKELTACPNHATEEVEYVCREHDQLCCSKCANTVHRKCDHLETIADLMDKPNASDTKPIVVLGQFEDFAKKMKEHEDKHKKAIE
ncbi:transcription intermediary factor 1-beta-like [Mya arenaria]|uniref:transcription intermediary factor 1-beta-like n=1 Tax=Mya arenaria TaxID=6604 RepID=UPI0022E1E871|nr:transcription intermediary factor 1-beta-like [Mya arenaria]